MRKLSISMVAAAVALLIMPGMATGKSKSGFPTPGERAQAMGNAFVAVANDTNAIFWNPAGMALIKDRQAQISHTDLYGLGIDYNYVAYAQNLYGVAWAHIDTGSFLMGSEYTGGGGDFSQDMYLVAFGRQMDPQTYIGASLKWHQMKYSSPSSAVDDWLDEVGGMAGGENSDGFSIDVGALYLVDEATTIGATVRDLFGKFKTKNSTRTVSGDSLDPDMSVGFSRKAAKDSLYSIQISSVGKESTVHLGFEKAIQPEFVLRAGLDDEIVTAGFGFRRNEWELNYSYKNKPALGLDQTQRFGAIVHF